MGFWSWVGWGAKSKIHRKKKVNLGKPKVIPGKPLENLSESIVMMIYYCLQTGFPLRSQWELQESVVNSEIFQDAPNRPK